jgi:hypothetical protein
MTALAVGGEWRCRQRLDGAFSCPNRAKPKLETLGGQIKPLGPV